MSTARQNKRVVCRILSDSPQKACPSQSSAQRPRPTLPPPLRAAWIMWQDKTVMSRDGGPGLVDFNGGRLIKKGQKHRLSAICQPALRRVRAWRTELASNKQAGIKKHNNAADNQLCDISVSFCCLSGFWGEIIITLKDQRVKFYVPKAKKCHNTAAGCWRINTNKQPDDYLDGCCNFFLFLEQKHSW